MPHSLRERIDAELGASDNIKVIGMFGGHCFMLNGNMLVCSMRDGSMLARIGISGMTEALKRPGVSIMDMNGRPMKDYVVVAPNALTGATALRTWIEAATAFVAPMPPKKAKARPKAKPKP